MDRCCRRAPFALPLLIGLAALAAHPPLVLAKADPESSGPTKEVKEGEAVEEGEWAPLEPEDSKYDWIELNTGEWLKGKIRLIQNNTLYFDSSKLDDLEFDWQDVSELLSGREHTFRFTGRRIVVGNARMRGQTIRIRSGDQIQEFERSEFVSMTRGSGKELNYWSLRMGLGLSGQSGNTEQLSLNAQLRIARETALTVGLLKYNGNIATQQNELSANNHRAVAAYNIYLTHRLYLIVPSVEVFSDEFQNIALRLTPALGLGYNIVDRKTIRLQAGLAAGYQGTKFLSVEGSDDIDSDVALPINIDFDLDLPKRFEWENNYQVQLVVTDIGKTNQHLSSTFSVDLWGPIDLETSFQWDWVNQPTADAAGNVPEENDFRISAGFALDL
jgi:putative salt-induced outer membrane protein YdiY